MASFYLLSVSGAVKNATRQYGLGLMLFGAAFPAASFLLPELGLRWLTSWPHKSTQRADIFSYRNYIRILATANPSPPKKFPERKVG